MGEGVVNWGVGGLRGGEPGGPGGSGPPAGLGGLLAAGGPSGVLGAQGLWQAALDTFGDR